MSTITKEQLIEEAKQAVEGCRRLLRVSPDVEAHKISLRLAEIALASLEAEAVALISERNLKNLGKSYSVYVKHEPVMVRPIPLFTAAPAPVSVPDFGALTKCIVQRLVDYGAADDDAIASAEEFVYNACRVAMLQSFCNSEQLNSPVIADGWVACSKRMPESMVSVLVTGTWFHHAVSFWDGVSWCDLDFEQPVTHWQPLPAAPQQEVK